MTVKELIYRLKDFPRDAVVRVRGKSMRRPVAAASLALEQDDRTDGDGGMRRKAAVRIVGAEG